MWCVKIPTVEALRLNNYNRRRAGRTVTIAGTRVHAYKTMKSVLGIGSHEDLPPCVIGGVRREWPNKIGNKYRTPGHEEPYIDQK